MSLIISKSKIIEVAFTYTTADTGLIKDHKITQIENTLVRDVIGSDLWAQIRETKLDGTISDEDLLLLNNYIIYIISYGVYADLIPHLYSKSSTSGIHVLTRENSTNEVQTMQQHKTHAVNTYQYYQSEMIEYICDNMDDYPLYKQSSTAHMNRSSETSTIGGILFYDSNIRPSERDKYKGWNDKA